MVSNDNSDLILIIMWFQVIIMRKNTFTIYSPYVRRMFEKIQRISGPINIRTIFRSSSTL